jgi:hypothetical protein
MVIGRRFGIGNDIFEIVGVAADGFTGTEPGMVADIFAPTMMSVVMPRPEASWLKTFVHLQPGVAPGPVRDHLRAAFRASNDDGAKGSQVLLMEPAAVGVSSLSFLQGQADCCGHPGIRELPAPPADLNWRFARRGERKMTHTTPGPQPPH